MVDERQLARDILDNLFEKTHCDCNIDWCLYEIYPELQIGESHPRQQAVLRKPVDLLYYVFWSIIRKSLAQVYQDFPYIISLCQIQCLPLHFFAGNRVRW